MRNRRGCGAELLFLSRVRARRRGGQVGQGQDPKRRRGRRHNGSSHWEHGVKRQHGFDSKVKRAYEALRVRPGAASILVIAFFAATNRLTSAWQRSRAARASAIWAGLPSALAPSNWAIAALERIKSDHIPFNKVSCRRQQTVACILLAFAMSGHIPSRHWLISVNL
jgi:hypothetical protein